jgi:hypothetical protein
VIKKVRVHRRGLGFGDVAIRMHTAKEVLASRFLAVLRRRDERLPSETIRGTGRPITRDSRAEA